MLEVNKNFKDASKDSIKDTFSVPTPLAPSVWSHFGSYTKIHKLITALYMVTDIIDKEDPIRNKLRTFGVEILSDTASFSRGNLGRVGEKITTIVSFLDIASAVNIISEMNRNILRKEFLELSRSILESDNKIKTLNGSINLSEFLETSPSLGEGEDNNRTLSFNQRQGNSKGHTRIGVQKGSTLMKALSDKTHFMSGDNLTGVGRNNFDALKKQRREGITNIIKSNGGSATIKDIKEKMNTGTNGLPVCGEKTLQRELMSMTKDGVLNKTGEKRWSRYFTK
jgi:hypothetical protein